MTTHPVTPSGASTPLTSVDEALARLLAGIAPSGRVDTVATPQAWGRVLAQEVVSDVVQGQVLMPAGHRMDSGSIGLAVALGLATLDVAARNRVALLTTGDELVMPGTPLPPGAIYNSNRFMLEALLRGQGCIVTDFGNVPDRLDVTQAMLREAAHDHDLILSSGGVSVGEEDHLRAALQIEGRLDLWAVAIKPGKPIASGVVRNSGAETLFLGLPGNPVASYITFLVFARPVLARLQGASVDTPCLPMRADFSWHGHSTRREFLRVRRNANGGLDLCPKQGSGMLTSVVMGDGLADILPGQVVQPGDAVRYLSLAEIAS